MGRIVVNPEELESLAGQVRHADGDFQALHGALRSMVGGMTWEARAVADLEGRMDEVNHLLGRVTDCIGTMEQFLRQKAQEFREADDRGSLAGRVLGLVSKLLAPIGLVAKEVWAGIQRVMQLGRLLTFQDFTPAVVLGVPWFLGLLDRGSAPPFTPQPGAAVVPQAVPGPEPGTERVPNADELKLIQWTYGIKEDGYGPETQAKMREVQQQHGIPIDPSVAIGAVTWGLVMSDYRNKVAAGPAGSDSSKPAQQAPSNTHDQAQAQGDARERYDSTNYCYAKEHPNFGELATGALNRSEVEALVKQRYPKLWNAMRPTFEAEGHEWLRNVVGNFDGQGASVGIIQWNFGQHSLQPLLQKMADQHPDLWNKIFNDGRGQELLNHMNDLDWVKHHLNDKTHMAHEWAVDFDMLVATKEFQQIQLDSLQDPGGYWSTALDQAQYWGIHSERGVAALFNASVQSGRFYNEPRAIQVWEQHTGLQFSDYKSFGQFQADCADRIKGLSDVEKIEIFRDVYAAQANPRWAADVRQRFDKILSDSTLSDGQLQ